jgi:hypothetical protein
MEKTVAETIACLAEDVRDVTTTMCEYLTTVASGRVAMESMFDLVRCYAAPFVEGPVPKRSPSVRDDRGLSRMVYDIEQFLTDMFSVDIARDFSEIVASFGQASDAQRREKLVELKEFVFSRLMGRWDATKGDYSKVPWHTRYRGMAFKETFLSARFFMLGYRKETDLRTPTVSDIDAVAFAMKEFYALTAEQTKNEKMPVHLVEALWQMALAGLCRMLALRHHHHCALPA